MGRVEPAAPIELNKSRVKEPIADGICELTRDFHPVSRSGEGLQVCPDRGCPRLQLASGSPTLRAGQMQILVTASCSLPKPVAPQFHGWHAISATHVDAAIVKDLQLYTAETEAAPEFHLCASLEFGGSFRRPIAPAMSGKRTRHSLVVPALCM